jgi:RNA polymerase sigma factor (sigma-70 family)
MPSSRSLNDEILHPFLNANDSAASQRELMFLLCEHAEPRMRGIIYSRLRSHFTDNDHLPDFEDLYSEAKTKLVGYLTDLKSDLTAPCEDFRSYAATVARNVCNDYLRQTYPVRARLHKKIRDMLHSHPNLGMWRPKDEKGSDWVCGFNHWRGQQSSPHAESWLHQFYQNSELITDALAAGNDIQVMELDDLLSSTFKQVGGPIKVTDAVSLVSDIKGIKDRPIASFDYDEVSIRKFPPDSKLRIDSVLEMREPLMLAWQALRELPPDEFKAYLLYARTSGGEALIPLLIDAQITTELEISRLLGMTIHQFWDVCVNRLPMDNESIAKELGARIGRVYKLRCNAYKRLKKHLALIESRNLAPQRKKSHCSPS